MESSESCADEVIDVPSSQDIQGTIVPHSAAPDLLMPPLPRPPEGLGEAMQLVAKVKTVDHVAHKRKRTEMRKEGRLHKKPGMNKPTEISVKEQGEDGTSFNASGTAAKIIKICQLHLDASSRPDPSDLKVRSFVQRGNGLMQLRDKTHAICQVTHKTFGSSSGKVMAVLLELYKMGVDKQQLNDVKQRVAEEL